MPIPRLSEYRSVLKEWLRQPTVPLTRNLPPLVSRETRRVSRETRITELWGVEYITRKKPVYIGKLMTPPVLISAID